MISFEYITGDPIKTVLYGSHIFLRGSILKLISTFEKYETDGVHSYLILLFTLFLMGKLKVKHNLIYICGNFEL